MIELLERRLEIEGILRRATPTFLAGCTPKPGIDAASRIAALGIQQKGSHSDLVTVHDKRVEEFILAEIHRVFGDEGVIGEESSTVSREKLGDGWKGKSFWLLDPIDGTANYSKGYPFFASTLAFAHWDASAAVPSVLACATWDPVHNEMFCAHRGGGAWLNRERLWVSPVQDPQRAMLTTGFASQKQKRDTRAFDLFQKVTNLSLGVRRDGAASMDLAYVAAGRTEGYWEKSLSPWDTASGILLVEEAGGRVSHWDNSPINVFSGEIMATNGFLHKWLQENVEME